MVVSLRSLVTEQAKVIEKLGLEIVELRARLGMNSRNSSKPPSSDGYEKPAPKSRRVRSGKKPGKQPGDPGHHLAQRADPDATKIHRPPNCSKCGEDLSDAEVSGIITRQVFDLPPVALFCTEHRAERKRCRCGAETTGTFPNEATAPACYGPALRAYVCYLVTRQHIPIARVAELLHDTYGAAISTGTIISMVKEGAAMLEEFLTQVRDLLRDTDVVHADETGLRVEAALAADLLGPRCPEETAVIERLMPCPLAGPVLVVSGRGGQPRVVARQPLPEARAEGCLFERVTEVHQLLRSRSEREPAPC